MSEEVEIEETEEMSISDALEAAIDEHEQQEPEQAGRQSEDAEESVGHKEERDEKGRFAKQESEPQETRPAQQTDIEDVAGSPEQPQKSIRAPQSWKPLARESWETLPDSVKEEVSRREAEINTRLQEGAESRKVGEQFKQVVEKFSPVIAAEGVQNPIEGVQNLLGTISSLRMGTPTQKATLMAGLIQNYGIDLQMLDTALAASVNPGAIPYAPQAPMPPPADPRVDKLFTMIDQAKQQKQQQSMQAANSEVATFGQSHEFFEDVREEMADLIEVFDKRGVELSLEDAYNRAIAMHPEISQVMQQRQAVQSAGASTERTRRAASSIKGSPSKGAPKKTGTSLRDALEDAFDQAG
jgi:hypothetical protein